MKKLMESISWPMVLLLVGALMSGVGAFFLTSYQKADKAKFEQELRIKSDEIAELNKTILPRLREEIAFVISYCLRPQTEGSPRL